MDRDAEERYRDKYFQLLEEVEEKERSWDGMGQRLSHVVSHLAIVAEGPATPEISAELAAIRDALRERLDLDALEARLEALKERVLRETRWAEQPEPLPPVHEVLIHVVERLPLPPDLSEGALELIERLEAGIAPDALPEAIDSVAGLVYRIRARMQQEKRELESLLREVTDRLQEMDGGLGTAHREAEAGFASSRDLDAAVRAQVKDLEADTRGATDLEALRSSVGSALESIRSHLEVKQSEDAQRETRLRGELDRLRRTVSQLEGEVEDYREKTRQARELSLRDPLTGCFNRLAYQERAEAEEARWQRYRSPLSLLVLDLDRFKTINDTFGHRAGDKVLATVAQLSGNQLRQVDFFGRYGGEEFVALLPETPLDAAKIVAEKIRRAVEAFRFHSRGKRVPLTISCGVAQLRDGDTLGKAFERADRALYAAKEAGRNRTVTEGALAESP
jgi:diguanylate cyclase